MQKRSGPGASRANIEESASAEHNQYDKSPSSRQAEKRLLTAAEARRFNKRRDRPRAIGCCFTFASGDFVQLVDLLGDLRRHDDDAQLAAIARAADEIVRRNGCDWLQVIDSKFVSGRSVLCST